MKHIYTFTYQVVSDSYEEAKDSITTKVITELHRNRFIDGIFVVDAEELKTPEQLEGFEL